MKRLSIIFFFATVFCIMANGASAQNITYIGEDLKPATATNYTYKRVIKYVKPSTTPDGYGGVIFFGLHICSLMDYYKTGEPALVLNVVSSQLNCADWSPDGQAVYYYKNGNIKRKEFYKSGKLQGTRIFYNEDGTEQKREDYESGKLIEINKFSVSADNPLIGLWKYQEFSPISGKISKLTTANFSTNGVLEITLQDVFINGKSYQNTTEKTNWKYISQSNSSGILEQYQGDDLLFRGNVKWISRNQFEYTNTFHTNPNAVGYKLLYTKQ